MLLFAFIVLSLAWCPSALKAQTSPGDCIRFVYNDDATYISLVDSCARAIIWVGATPLTGHHVFQASGCIKIEIGIGAWIEQIDTLHIRPARWQYLADGDSIFHQAFDSLSIYMVKAPDTLSWLDTCQASIPDSIAALRWIIDSLQHVRDSAETFLGDEIIEIHQILVPVESGMYDSAFIALQDSVHRIDRKIDSLQFVYDLCCTLTSSGRTYLKGGFPLDSTGALYDLSGYMGDYRYMVWGNKTMSNIAVDSQIVSLYTGANLDLCWNARPSAIHYQAVVPGLGSVRRTLDHLPPPIGGSPDSVYTYHITRRNNAYYFGVYKVAVASLYNPGFASVTDGVCVSELYLGTSGFPSVGTGSFLFRVGIVHQRYRRDWP